MIIINRLTFCQILGFSNWEGQSKLLNTIKNLYIQDKVRIWMKGKEISIKIQLGWKNGQIIVLIWTEKPYIFLMELRADIGGLVQESHNFIANALELCLSCTNSSIYDKTIALIKVWIKSILQDKVHTAVYFSATAVVKVYIMPNLQ